MLINERVLVAASIGPDEWDFLRLSNLIVSMGHCGGELGRARYLVFVPAGLPVQMRQALTDLGVEVREHPALHPARYSNSLALHPLNCVDDGDDYDVLIALGLDAVIAGDFSDYVSNDALGARLAYHSAVTDRVWAQAATLLDKTLPAIRPNSVQDGAARLPCFDPGLLIVPKNYVARLRAQWQATSERLQSASSAADAETAAALADPALGLSFALLQRDLPLKLLPLALGFPLPGQVHESFVPHACEPLILSCVMDATALQQGLPSSGYARADAAVQRINALLISGSSVAADTADAVPVATATWRGPQCRLAEGMRLAQDPVFDATRYFTVPLLDLGPRMDAKLAGIFMPKPEIGREKVGVTDQFLAHAENYHERYIDLPYFRMLLGDVLRRIGQLPTEALVLDIGSGSGNTVMPCLDLLEKSLIVATDISPNLLEILKRSLDTDTRYRGRTALVCMDATQDYFTHSSFDLVVGAFILHHLIEPQAAVIAAGRALKPGGTAVFFEPFENGGAIMRIAYTQILKEVERGKSIEPAALAVIRAMLRDYEARMALTPASTILKELDDKWFFTRSFFEQAAEAAGFSAVTVYPIHPVDEPFSAQLRVHLRLSARLGPEALDAWAWDILRFYDNVFSDALKRDLLIEGAVILSK